MDTLEQVFTANALRDSVSHLTPFVLVIVF